MDKNLLKDFAIQSRIELINRIDLKLKLYYIDEEFEKKELGEIYELSNSNLNLKLTSEEYNKRELLIKRIKEIGYDRVLEEAAYTWFNRLIAIRYMEIHNYLPLGFANESLGIRVLSSNDNTPNPEILKFSNLINEQLDINFNKETYYNLKNDNEKFKYVLQLVCNKLKKVVPDVFGGLTDYIDLLIPENMLSETGFISKMLKEIPENNFSKVEIIGWLYQYWNTDSFNKIYDGDMTKKKIDAEDLPAATQLFTPDWCVQYMVDNTLGRYWLEHNDFSDFENDLNYYVKDNNLVKEKNVDPKTIKFLDPCCGSGHILVYALEVLYKIYVSYGYNKNDIIENILKYNLYGLDIDNRAGQLSILSVLLKSREYDKDIFNKEIIQNLNVRYIYNSNNISDFSIEMINDIDVKKKVEKLVSEFKYAKDFGSLSLVSESNWDDVIEYVNNDNTMAGYELRTYLIPLINQAKIINNKYDIVVTNPPYLANGRMNKVLSDFIKKNYPMSKCDLSSVFLDKTVNEYLKENGYVSFITTKSWMYLQSFEEIRNYIVHNKQFVSIADYGTELFDGKIGHLPIVSWVSKNTLPKNDLIAIKLSDFNYSRRNEKQTQFFNNNNYYYINQESFLNIPGTPIAYWIDKEIENVFNNKNVGDYFQAKQGMTTADNNRFLRHWFEVDFNNIGFKIGNKKEALESKKRWFPYNKGGEYRKWYGNNDYVVNWYNDGEELKQYTSTLPQGTAVRLKSQDYYFKESVTWSFIGSRFGVRYSPKGAIFDVGGSSIFPEKNMEYLIAFLNTNIADYLLKIINPTMNYQIKDVRLLPFIMDKNNYDNIVNLYNKCLNISIEDWNSYETSWDFKIDPLVKYKEKKNIKNAFISWKDECDNRFNLLKKYEEELNEIFINIYNLENNVCKDVLDKDVTLKIPTEIESIKNFISYFVGCLFGRYSPDKEGIVCSSKTSFDLNNYLVYKPDEDNVVPVSDKDIIYYNDDIVSKFKDFVKYIFGEEYFVGNFDYIAEILGRKGTETSEDTIRRYFINDFYTEHVKMYQKRPIYWLFDSGKKNGFKAFIYSHRYDEQLISKIRVNYLHKTQDALERIKNELNYKLNNETTIFDRKEIQNSLVELNNKIQECNSYDEKIGHVANLMISLCLDDGVKTNYEKFADILAKIK